MGLPAEAREHRPAPRPASASCRPAPAGQVLREPERPRGAFRPLLARWRGRNPGTGRPATGCPATGRPLTGSARVIRPVIYSARNSPSWTTAHAASAPHGRRSALGPDHARPRRSATPGRTGTTRPHGTGGGTTSRRPATPCRSRADPDQGFHREPNGVQQGHVAGVGQGARVHQRIVAERAHRTHPHGAARFGVLDLVRMPGAAGPRSGCRRAGRRAIRSSCSGCSPRRSRISSAPARHRLLTQRARGPVRQLGAEAPLSKFADGAGDRVTIVRALLRRRVTRRST
ncbi:hypothetical protein SHIRM173S_11829 [Streptomyces hirsutus]